MRNLDVTANKIIYRNKTTAYTVFQGVVLRWAPRKKEFMPTKEIYTFVGYLFCIFPGDRFTLEAVETSHPVYGTQYMIAKSTRQEPASEVEIRHFLMKNIKGMTPKRVEKVMDKYGLEAISALRKDAGAYDFLKLSKEETDSIRISLMDNAVFEDIMVWLQIHSLDCRFALPLYQKYKDAAVPTLRDNPYLPFVDDIFDFKTADRLYVESGKDLQSMKRCLYTTLATIQIDSSQGGNVFTRRRELKDKMMGILTETAGLNKEEMFPFSHQNLDVAVEQLSDMGYIISDICQGENCLYLSENYYDERQIVRCLTEKMSAPKRVVYSEPDINLFLVQYQKDVGITLAKEQVQAVKTALTSPISIISGGPGTGKTQTINTIMAAVRALSPEASIRACAPTGKAAIRIMEITGVQASTIHRALGVGKYQGELRRGELACDFMFVDEFSMVDIHLCAKLFDAVAPSGRLVIVGDCNQLPSVGPGLVLRDLIASGVVPTTMLSQIFRQNGGSRIVKNANCVITQVPGQSAHLSICRKPGGDFYVVDEPDPQKVLEKIKEAIETVRQNYGYGIEQTQVLSPVHFGDLGAENLNRVLQQFINPSAISIHFEDKEFRLGDKVTHIKNNYSLEVFNGEVGVISDIAYTSDRAVKVTYPDRDVWYPFSSLTELELAYALTVHKLQGSEYPVIIMPVHQLQGRGLSKNLLYTAFTRAKKIVILIGNVCALQEGLRRETIMERTSNLVASLSLPGRTICCSSLTSLEGLS